MKSFRTYISILKSVKNRPTKHFIYLVLIIVSLFLQAYMHNYNIVYIMMFFLVGIGSASSIYGILNLLHIKLSILSHERFFAQMPSFFTLTILNNSSRSVYDINVAYKDKTQKKAIIDAYQSATIKFTTMFENRGEAKISEFKISSLFPLPHEIKYKTVTLQEKIFVYANPSGVSLFSIYNKNSALSGEIDDFDGIKDYEEGGSLSTIHWASLAKHATLKTKTFLYEDEQKSLHFSFDTLKGEAEERLSQLTLWVLECEKHHLEFTLDINTTQLDSKEQNIDEILRTIASY